uniref:Uncharacterized protein n=1 Tax=Oryza glumipatula TaxID=40148 RepID=A0A0E0B9X5_9ORYZ
MANLVAMNMKRKEHAEVANNGLSIFLDPKRLKLQIPDMMEEEKPSAGVQLDPTVPTMALSWMLPTQGQETTHDTMNTAYEMSSSETPPLRADQAAAAAPMDVEVQLRGSLRRRRVSRLISGQVSEQQTMLTRPCW